MSMDSPPYQTEIEFENGIFNNSNMWMFFAHTCTVEQNYAKVGTLKQNVAEVSLAMRQLHSLIFASLLMNVGFSMLKSSVKNFAALPS